MSQKIYKRLVIGGGPAGIAFAIESKALGVDPEDILVLEKGADPLAAVRQFYPEKKMTLPNYKGLPVETYGFLDVFPELTKIETLDYFSELVAKHQIKIEVGKEVSKVVPRADFFEVQCGEEVFYAKVVAIGIGILGRPNKPSYKMPLKLRKHLLFDMTSQEIKNQKVLVVGGGDTAGEYCQYLLEAGNQITLSYRRENFHRMMKTNQDAVEKLSNEQKIKVRLNSDIEGLEEENEKPLVVFKDGTREVFDKVLYALGGTTPVNFLKTIGVEFEDGWPVLSVNGATNIPNLYLIGDLQTGKRGGSIIMCYKSAFFAAKTLAESQV